MNGHELSRHYEGAHRIIHYEKPPPEFAIKASCFEGLALFERDMAMIERLKNLYLVPVSSNKIKDTQEKRGRTPIFKEHAEAMSIMAQEGVDIAEIAAKFSSKERPLAPYYAHRLIDDYRRANGIKLRVIENRYRKDYGISKVTMQRLPEIIELIKFRDKKTGLGYKPYRIAFILGMHHSTLGAAVKYIKENKLL